MRSLHELIESRRHGKPLGLGKSTEAWVLETTLDRYLAVQSPFDGYLEAPEALNHAYRRHGDSCRDAAEALRAAMRPVLEELLAAVELEEQRRGKDFR